VIFLAGLTILKKVRCLGRLSGWGVDPVVALPLRNAADYRLPTFGPHDTKLGPSWYQWIIKSDFLAGLTILKKERCLSRLSGCRADPAIALRLWNAADYRLPTLGPHGIKLGHSWYQWIIEIHFSGWFDNIKKGDVFGHCEWIWGDPAVVLPQRNAAEYRLPTFGPHDTKLGPSWYQWIIKSDFLAGLTILKKERCLSRLSGCRAAPAIALRLWNAADYRLPTLGPHGIKLGHSWYQWIIEIHFSGWFDNLKKGDVFGHCEWIWVDPVVALHLWNAADYRLPPFGPHVTKLGHSQFQL